MTKEGILDDHKSVLSSSGISTKDEKISPLFVWLTSVHTTSSSMKPLSVISSILSGHKLKMSSAMGATCGAESLNCLPFWSTWFHPEYLRWSVWLIFIYLTVFVDVYYQSYVSFKTIYIYWSRMCLSFHIELHLSCLGIFCISTWDHIYNSIYWQNNYLMKVDNALTICGNGIESKSYNILKNPKRRKIKHKTF
jgi:hypothetical protein